jgi:hypothetical protein
MAHRTYSKIPGFRLGVFVFKDAEIVDYAAPHGVFSVARRFDPELDVFLIAASRANSAPEITTVAAERGPSRSRATRALHLAKKRVLSHAHRACGSSPPALV